MHDDAHEVEILVLALVRSELQALILEKRLVPRRMDLPPQCKTPNRVEQFASTLRIRRHSKQSTCLGKMRLIRCLRMESSPVSQTDNQ